MKKMIGVIDKLSISIVTIKLDSLRKILLPEFKEIDGCILGNFIDSNIPEKINLNMIKTVYGDRTGYEASRNELRVNDYVDYSEKEAVAVLVFALQLIECWGYKLKNDFPQYKFSLILSCNNQHVTLRFHRNRNDEFGWLEEDLENYNEEAILIKQV